MKGEKSKRDLVLEAALTLFAEKGFDGVGVDDIAKAAGIKGPSLYYYFKSKDSILDELISINTTYYAENFEHADKQRMLPDTLEEFVQASLGRLRFTLHDPTIQKFRRLLIMEQFRNMTFRELATLHHVTIIQNMNQQMIAHLIERGQIKPYDAKLLAFEFAFPVSMMIQWIDREPDKEEIAMRRIMEHMEHFCNIYGVEKKRRGEDER